MRHEMPDLWLAKQRMAEIRVAAREARGLPSNGIASVRSPSRRRFTGLHLHMGRLLIVVGRTMTEEDATCPDPVCL
jgi:hypothetical protein